MEPIRYRKGCTGTYSGKCVKWDGPNIKCLDICTGDSLTDVVHEIATLLCKTIEDIDVSTLDLTCLLKQVPLTPEQKTVKKVIELILTNQCDLKKYIDDLVAGSEEEPFNINVKCLQLEDQFGQPTIKTRDQLLQRIVNYICNELEPRLGSIETDLDDHEDRIHTLETKTTQVVLPTISTCISIGAELDDALIETATVVCDLRTKIGTSAEVQNAITSQCDGLSDELPSALRTKLIKDVKNISHTLTNIWIAVCDVRARVKAIEENCCASNCASIKLGFSVVVGDGGNVTVRWRAADGTEIPPAFKDSGDSTIVFTDIDGNVEEFPIEVENNGSTEFDISGLNLDDKITASVNAILERDGLTCEKCVSKQFDPMGGCPTCLITTEGSGTVTIVYETT